MIVVEYRLTVFGRFVNRRSVIAFFDPVLLKKHITDRSPLNNDPFLSRVYTDKLILFDKKVNSVVDQFLRLSSGTMILG
jgi:hypothetical protein